MPAGLAKTQNALAQAQARAKNIRQKYSGEAQKIERTMAIGASGFALGLAESNDVIPVAMFGVPSKLGISVISHLVAANTDGAMGRVANAAGDAALGVYAYQAAKTKSFIAGEEDV